jgi:hypothetical protein
MDSPAKIPVAAPDALWIKPVLEAEIFLSADEIEQFLRLCDETDSGCARETYELADFLSVGNRIQDVCLLRKFLCLVPNFALYKTNHNLGKAERVLMSRFVSSKPPALFNAQRSMYSSLDCFGVMLECADRSYHEFQEAMQGCAKITLTNLSRAQDSNTILQILLCNGWDIEDSSWSVVLEVANYGYNFGPMTPQQRAFKRIVVDHLAFCQVISAVLGEFLPIDLLYVLFSFTGRKPTFVKVCHKTYDIDEFWTNCLSIDVCERIAELGLRC